MRFIRSPLSDGDASASVFPEGDDRAEPGLGEHAPSTDKFPFSDLEKVHRCAVIFGEGRAGQYDHDEVRDALADLLARIDAE
ncbi:hypothetical protein SCMU_40260 [Sinomonas cyclohexanicum]|uniref:DivIVA domain-containing protein n=1 Tax=Sinomonas cyclohexanicum TaxID=322009 RepID=A0ABM7Q0T3_SINCY|nr:hypothetical protein [Corynebacterium cyclohexanicum]BCT78184.1 hypothetical protein SCMU_40260 [Corynebacterium cyclohexanicum]